MKKTTACLLALTLCFCTAMSTTAFAADFDQDNTETPSTDITFDYKDQPNTPNEPSFIIVIPDTIDLTEEGTVLRIEAENVQDLGDQRISVTIAGSDKYRNQMVLEGKAATAPVNQSLRYQLIAADGTIIETTGGKDQVNGVELASFTEDGEIVYTMKPVITASSKKDVVYTGSIFYNIELVPVADIIE